MRLAVSLCLPRKSTMKKNILLILLALLVSCDQQIRDFDLPTACFDVDKLEVYWGEYFTFTNCSDNAYSYYWSFGDGYSTSEPFPKYRYVDVGEYVVTLYAHNDDGVDSTKLNVVVNDGCGMDMTAFDYSFGIDYENPDEYLIPGTQSDISSKYVDEVIASVGEVEYSIPYLKKVCEWVNSNFTTENAWGGMIGEVHVNELFEQKIVYGCHSSVLVLSSIIRKMGFPSVMMETASITWAWEYMTHTNDEMAGHVMTEVYVNNKWVLLDNCLCVEDYNPLNPYVSMVDKEKHYYQDGLFVVAKGVDTWDYFKATGMETHELLISFAPMLKCHHEYIGSIEYSWK